MNVLIKGLQDKLWVSYSHNGGELSIDSIYLDSDPDRTDVYDYLSDSVIGKAYLSIEEDYMEVRADMGLESYKSSRYGDSY